MLKQTIILIHRYLGIPLSFVFVVWFVSGIAMMYSGGMPETSDAERLARQEALDLGSIRIGAAEAFAAARAGSAPVRAELEMLLGRPVYRFDWFRATAVVFADSGELLDEVTTEDAVAIAAHFAGVPEERVRYIASVDEPDQWTLLLSDELPLYRLDVDDEASTQIYVAPGTGEVRLATTRKSRALAWAGAIPHWFYFTPLRVNQPLWYWLVVWVSAAGCVLAVLGLALGIVQFRRSKPFRLLASIRYQGSMRWHYIFGAFFGIFALTWVFSGMLSMEPFTRNSTAGFELPRDTFTGGTLDFGDFAVPDARAFGTERYLHILKEIELLRIQDQAYFLARYVPAAFEDGRTDGDPERLLVSAATMAPRPAPFSVESILSRIHSAAPAAAIDTYDLLESYDAYYYARAGAAPLPVLRIKFADADASWYYVDPRTSRVVFRAHKVDRLQRWLFNGLHSLDFAFWYDRRPLWDLGMIILCLGALGSSLIGAYLGIKRLRGLSPKGTDHSHQT